MGKRSIISVSESVYGRSYIIWVKLNEMKTYPCGKGVILHVPPRIKRVTQKQYFV